MAFDAATVRAALRRVWPDAATVESAEIRALGGGLTPRTFLAVAGSQRYVLRMPQPCSVALLDLDTEARAMRAAAAADLAPAVVAIDADAGLLLTEYRNVPAMPGLLRQPRVLAMIVRRLRALHALRVELPIYAVAPIASSYRSALERASAARSDEEGRWAEELSQLGRQFDSSFPPTAFCHNDLAASNILIDGATAIFIDFEYAGRGAPLLDLASLAGMNDFAERERRHLLYEYYGGASAAPTLGDLDSAIRMQKLLAYFWARVAEARGADASTFAGLAAGLGATLR
jgi:aminoglycoside phosphotransferase (APT) family kinase protein